MTTINKKLRNFECEINRFSIKGENLVTRKRRIMKIVSSISGSKVLIFGNTKIELDFKGKKRLSKNNAHYTYLHD